MNQQANRKERVAEERMKIKKGQKKRKKELLKTLIQ
jgi:hypothetical protein